MPSFGDFHCAQGGNAGISFCLVKCLTQSLAAGLRFSLLLSALLSSALFCHADETPPNVIFIAVDDLKASLGCYGDEVAVTPNIDALAARGTVFRNNHCQQAVCGPSRASIMTGLYPDKSRIVDFGIQMREAVPGVVTIPQYFKQNGYYANGMGKIYDGRNVDGWNSHDVASWSEPYFLPWPSTASEMERGYYDPDTVAAIRAYRAEHGNLNTPSPGELFPAVESHINRPDSNYVDCNKADFAVTKIGQLASGDSPFFLAIGFDKPHLPFVAPTRYWDLYERDDFDLAQYQRPAVGSPNYAAQNSGELEFGYDLPEGSARRPIPDAKQRELIHGYYACVSMIDAQVGKIMQAIDAAGIADNTIIVFWSDHGFHLGDHDLWTKHNVLENSTLSPLIIVAPGQKQTGTDVFHPTELVDVYPTLADLAGLPRPAMVQGVSLKPLLDDPDAKVREIAMSQYEHRDWSRGGARVMGYTFRDRRYRYTVWKDMNIGSGDVDGPIRSRELFDYQEDPLEQRNLIDDPDYAEVVESMERQRLRTRLAQETFATFGAPVDIPAAALERTYANGFVLHSGAGENVPAVGDFAINWDGTNLTQLEMTVGGTPMDLLAGTTHTLGQKAPSLTLTQAELAGTYHVVVLDAAVALVAADRSHTLYFTNAVAAPEYDPSVSTAFHNWAKDAGFPLFADGAAESFREGLLSYAMGGLPQGKLNITGATPEFIYPAVRSDLRYTVERSETLNFSDEQQPIATSKGNGNTLAISLESDAPRAFVRVKVEQ